MVRRYVKGMHCVKHKEAMFPDADGIACCHSCVGNCADCVVFLFIAFLATCVWVAMQ